MLVLAVPGIAGAWGTPTECIPGDANLDDVVDVLDVTAVQMMILGWLVDVTVTSDGCCPIDVSFTMSPGATVPAGETKTFYNIWSFETATVACDDSGEGCAFDSWSDGGAQTHEIVMAQSVDVDVTATCYQAYPPNCCWSIYLAQWWEIDNPPPNPPNRQEYIAWHTVELVPGNHTETGIWIYDENLQPDYQVDVTIPVPTYHQKLSAFAGPAPNGYVPALNEWDVLIPDPPTKPNIGIKRTNFMLGTVTAHLYEYWIDQSNRINMKSMYDLETILGSPLIYSWTVSVIPIVGNAGFPYATGNMWATIIVSGITPPTLYLAVVGEEELIDCGGYIPPLQCFKNESFIWDDDGDMVPEEGELTSSGVNYVSNKYPAPIKVDTGPGQLYYGWESRCLIWYCFDPPFAPWN